MNHLKASIDWKIIIVSIVLIFGLVVALTMNPTKITEQVSVVYEVLTNALGSFLLIFYAIGLLVCLYLAFGKYGKIRLGEGKPQYSMFSYVAMMTCAALASASVYYSFTEWADYYVNPTFRITPESSEAAEMATAYTFFHWGISVQVIFALTAVVLAYGVYVRKIPSLKISSIAMSMMKDSAYKKIVGKLIDIICVFCTVGGLGVTLGLGVPLISSGLQHIFNIQSSFMLEVLIVIAIALLFSFSSYIGVDKGMKKLSDYTVYLAIVLLGYILIVGPTSFILKQTTNSLGVMIDQYVRMSFWTDPIDNSGFPEAWTVFLFCLALNYAALMGVFITKISKGRTIRELILTCLIGISALSWILFGINGGFAMHAQLTGKFDIVGKVMDGNGQIGIFELLNTLPGGVIIPLAFLVLAICFLSTSLDSAAFSLSAISTKVLDQDGNTNPLLRLFWCLTLAAIPLAIMFTDSPFSTIRNITIIVGLPFVLIIMYLTFGLFKWLKEDTTK